MMSCDPRFAAYIKDALAAIDAKTSELTANRFLIQIAERWTEVLFDPADARLTFVAIIAAEDEVRAEMLGHFNAYNLFHGGYSLISPPETGCVYLAQSHAMAGIPPAELVPRLVDFEQRAGAAGTWYLTWTPESAGAAA